MARKVLLWTLGAFVLFFVASRPDGAASLTQRVGEILAAVANGFGDFLAGLGQ